MEIVIDGASERQARTVMTCAGCIYLSALGRCQRVKSKFYAQQIAFPENFGCARWERFGAVKAKEG